jgi:hypothetical protein
MIYLKWLGFTIADWLLLPFFFVAVPFASLFTKDGWGSVTKYLGTYDNPPQGDRGWIRERSPFPKIIDGWKGYINRVMWLWRNPNYPLQAALAVEYAHYLIVSFNGNDKISDKYAKPGWYFATATNSRNADTVAFEFYCVLPWAFGKCLRARLGWKIMSSKFETSGIAPLVNTINPFKTFGESV